MLERLIEKKINNHFDSTTIPIIAEKLKTISKEKF